jgi:hypothetical protein
MAKQSDDATSLKRLSGGSWQSRDGRFTIEQQSGRWVVVDAEQTDDLGLPRIRGPYPSLKVARASVEEVREEPAGESPLAGRIREAKSRPQPKAAGTARTTRAGRAKTEAEAPPEPAWLANLSAADGDRARQLIRDLEAAGLPDGPALVRRDVADGSPAVAEALLLTAIARRVRNLRGKGPAEAVADVVSWMTTHARDPELPMRLPGWRVVEDGPAARQVEVTRKELLAALEKD